MADELRISDYIERNLPVIFYLCRCRQWDGVSESIVKDWIVNFQDLEGRYYAVRILKHLAYYSENDLEALLRHGIFDLIIGREILKDTLLPSGFNVIPTGLGAEARRRLARTLFVPLLVRPGPDESGTQVVRMLTHRLGVPPRNVVFHWQVGRAPMGGYERLIVCDDCLGSGEQIEEFWSGATIEGSGATLRSVCSNEGWRPYYLALVGYEQRVQEIEGKLQPLEIVAAEALTERNRVFEAGTDFWEGEDEREAVCHYFERVERERGIRQRGFRGLDFGVVLHKTVPDWTVPMLWDSAPGWNIFLRRKNTYA